MSSKVVCRAAGGFSVAVRDRAPIRRSSAGPHPLRSVWGLIYLGTCFDARRDLESLNTPLLSPLQLSSALLQTIYDIFNEYNTCAPAG